MKSIRSGQPVGPEARSVSDGASQAVDPRSNAAIADQIRDGRAPSWHDPHAVFGEHEQAALADIGAFPMRAMSMEGGLVSGVLNEVAAQFDAEQDPEAKLSLFETMHALRVRGTLADDFEEIKAMPPSSESIAASDQVRDQYQTSFAEMNAEVGNLQARNFSADDVAALAERKDLELRLEDAYGLNITNDPQTPWQFEELTQMESFLRTTPSELIEGNETFTELHRGKEWKTARLNAAASMSTSGTMSFYDLGFQGDLEQTYFHELGHSHHNLEPELLERWTDLNSWNELTTSGAYNAMEGTYGEERANKRLRDMVDAADGPWYAFPEAHLGDQIVQSGLQSADFWSRDAGAVPESWNYAASNPKEHFAEMYGHSHANPDMVYSELMLEPSNNVATAQEWMAEAEADLAEARLTGQAHSIKGAQAMYDLVERRLQGAERSVGLREQQYEFFRTEVFGTDDSDILSVPRCEGEEEAFARLHHDAARAMTPDQLDEVRAQHGDMFLAPEDRLAKQIADAEEYYASFDGETSSFSLVAEVELETLRERAAAGVECEVPGTPGSRDTSAPER